MKKILYVGLLILGMMFFGISAAADDLGIDVYENGMTREEYYQKTIDQYETFDYSDPQYTTDEELFGEWDGEKWICGPLLDYESYPKLANIEAAAKNAYGDYGRCKELLMDYYNEKFDSFNLNTNSASTAGDKYKLSLEMQMDNFIARPALGPCPLSKMLVSSEAKWHKSTVLDAVTNILNNNDKRVTLHIYSLKKDGYTVKFNSIDSGENTPYIEATVNGTTVKFPAVMDTYISAGANAEKNYGTESYLLAEESYSSINKKATVDEYTRRSVLKFDFSELKSSDEVTSATLNLYGSMEKSDNPEESGIEKQSKIVFVLNAASDQTWNENTLKWGYIDDCGTVALSHDGTAGYVNESMLEFFPNVSAYRASIMSYNHDLTYFASYYAATKDEYAAYHILRIFMQKYREYKCDPDSTEQPTLNLWRVTDMVGIMDKCRSSKYMTPEIFTVMVKNAYEHAEAMVGSERFKEDREKIWNESIQDSNVGTIQTRALVTMGVVFSEFKAAKSPLGEEWGKNSYNGGWLKVASHRLELLLNNSVFPDGSLTDIPISYLWQNINEFINIVIHDPQKYNFDPNDVLDDWVIDILLSVGEYTAKILNPIYGEWQVGDAGNYTGTQNGPLSSLYNRFPNRVSEHLKYIATDGKAGSPSDDFTSYVGEYTNTAVLRSDWSKNSVSLNFQASSTYAHTHADDLSINLMAYGNYLLADPNRYTYAAGNPISDWQMSREAHSSIVVNNKNAQKMGGSLHPEDREFNKIYDYIHGESNSYYDHNHNRYILFVRPGYFIVTDHIESDDEKSNNYRQNWNFQPTANIALNESGQTYTSYPTMANITIAPVSFENELKAEIKEGYYSKTTNVGLYEPNKYVTYGKDIVGDTSFQTVLFPTNIGKDVDIQTEALASSVPEPKARAMRAIIKYSGYEYDTNYFILLDRAAKEEVTTYGTYKTDSEMSLTEYKDGQLSTIALHNGTFVEESASGKKIIAMKNLTEDIGISFNVEQMIIESSKANTDIDGMVIYLGDKKVSSAVFNGQSVAFNTKGKYIFFGDSPSYEIPEDAGGSSPENVENKDDSTYVPKQEVSSGNMSGGDSGGSGSKEEEDEANSDEKVENPTFEIPESFNKELEDYWGKNEIAAMIESGYVNGSDGKLKLADSITRAEFVTVLMRTLHIETAKYNGYFDDVSENDWFAKTMEAAYEKGIVSGYNAKADPNSFITREQIAKLLVNAYELKENIIVKDSKNKFNDKSEVSVWANDFIIKCSEAGLMNGYIDGSFKPLKNITRGEAFVTLYRLVNLIQK